MRRTVHDEEERGRAGLPTCAWNLKGAGVEGARTIVNVVLAVEAKLPGGLSALRSLTVTQGQNCVTLPHNLPPVPPPAYCDTEIGMHSEALGSLAHRTRHECCHVLLYRALNRAWGRTWDFLRAQGATPLPTNPARPDHASEERWAEALRATLEQGRPVGPYRVAQWELLQSL